MSDRREEMLNEDVQAFVRVTEQNLPPLETFTRGRGREQTQLKFKGDKMSILKRSKARRFALTSAVSATVLIGLFLVPVSYQRVEGWETRITLSAKSLNPVELKSIANELKNLIGAGPIRVELQAGEQGSQASLVTYVDARDNDAPQAALEAFAKFMGQQGYSTNVNVKPRVNTVSSSVWAMTLEKVIYVETAGKSAEEIENEITERFKEAGFENLAVNVTKEPGGEEGEDDKLRVGARLELDEEDCASGAAEKLPDLVLTRDGEIQSGNRVQIKRMRELVDGVETEVITIQIGEDKATVRIENIEELEDEQIAQVIGEQLQNQGIDLEVSVDNGKIKVGPYDL